MSQSSSCSCFSRLLRQKSSSVEPQRPNFNSSPVDTQTVQPPDNQVPDNQVQHLNLDITRSSPILIPKERTDSGLLTPGAMVDVRSSLSTSPRLIGSPPPSVLKERNKRRDRQQSRLAVDSGFESGIGGNVEGEEETVIPSGEESFPAIRLSRCPDVDSQVNGQNGAIVDSRQANTPSNSRGGRRSSLTPPPRLISFTATDGSTPAAQEWTAKEELP